MISQIQPITINRTVFDQYRGLSLPRHVSYPMPTWWTDMDADDRGRMAAKMDATSNRNGLSLYLHIPFCQALCKFCACSRIILRKTAPGAEDRTERYVQALIVEIKDLAAQFGTGRALRQIHWGGGTPTYLNERDIERITQVVHDAFDVAEDAEVSIEVDPRVTTEGQFKLLRRLGFNRISLGVQDFNAVVQEHVKRIQPFEMVSRTVDICRELGFDSINFDLIYGLPYQTMDTMRDTLEKVISLGPDRVAYYHYAQIPEKIATQVAIHHDQMPDSDTKLDMFMLGAEMFGAAGYDFIGLDHFARPDERLASAARDGTLQRNFQGMTTGGGLDLLGAGASSISHLQQVGFLQNERDVNVYVDTMLNGESVIRKGKDFTEDDCIRQAVLTQLYCGARIVPEVIETQFNIDFEAYFASELTRLVELEDAGLVITDDRGNIDATFPLGRVLLRNIAAIFDQYLEDDAYRVGVPTCYSANA